MSSRKSTTARKTVSLPEAARMIRRSWHAAYAALLRGDLVGEQRNGRWTVDLESVERFNAQQSAA